MSTCQKWGKNEGRWIGWWQEAELVNELQTVDEWIGDSDDEEWPTERSISEANRIANLIIDFGWSSTGLEEPGDEDARNLLILAKDDWRIIDLLIPTQVYEQWDIRTEPCAPTNHQGWEVAAGLGEEESK